MFTHKFHNPHLKYIIPKEQGGQTFILLAIWANNVQEERYIERYGTSITMINY